MFSFRGETARWMLDLRMAKLKNRRQLIQDCARLAAGAAVAGVTRSTIASAQISVIASSCKGSGRGILERLL
jgi:hypothetical protein